MDKELPQTVFLPPPNPILTVRDPLQDTNIHQSKQSETAIEKNGVLKRITFPSGTLQETYGNLAPVFSSCDNSNMNSVSEDKKRFFSGIFCDWKPFISDPKAPIISTKSELKSYLKSMNLLVERQPQQQAHPATIQFKHTLRFDSSFESGNLFASYQVGQKEYDLILMNDTNSKGNTQWFYFSVSNTIKNQTVHFNIVNLMKTDSLFNYGMLPAVFSTKKSKGTPPNQSPSGWFRGGINSSYSRNIITRDGNDKGYYYTLRFSYKFEHSQDTVYFAHCYPYTYSDLNTFLSTLISENSIEINKILKRNILCESLGKNKCETIVITSPAQQPALLLTSDQENKQTKTTPLPQLSLTHANKKKDIIIIMARQHPGETPGSWMVEGVIEFLASLQNEDAKYLRNRCIFKIIPMINPDGVIQGNYRTDLTGVDLNRKWFRPSKVLLPNVYAIKQLISTSIGEANKIRYIIDLHGHSKKMNAFFYGNPHPEDPMAPRIFPLICAAENPHIDFTQCTFRHTQSHSTTARISLHNYLSSQRTDVLTLEASFFGYTLGEGTTAKKLHYSIKDYKNIGSSICRSMALLYRQEESFAESSKKLQESALNSSPSSLSFSELMNMNVFQRLFRNYKCDPTEMLAKSVLNDERASALSKQSAENAYSSGSDSDPLADELTPNEISSIAAIQLTKIPATIAHKLSTSVRSVSGATTRSTTPFLGGGSNIISRTEEQYKTSNSATRTYISIGVQTSHQPWLSALPGIIPAREGKQKLEVLSNDNESQNELDSIGSLKEIIPPLVAQNNFTQTRNKKEWRSDKKPQLVSLSPLRKLHEQQQQTPSASLQESQSIHQPYLTQKRQQSWQSSNQAQQPTKYPVFGGQASVLDSIQLRKHQEQQVNSPELKLSSALSSFSAQKQPPTIRKRSHKFSFDQQGSVSLAQKDSILSASTTSTSAVDQHKDSITQQPASPALSQSSQAPNYYKQSSFERPSQFSQNTSTPYSSSERNNRLSNPGGYSIAILSASVSKRKKIANGIFNTTKKRSIQDDATKSFIEDFSHSSLLSSTHLISHSLVQTDIDFKAIRLIEIKLVPRADTTAVVSSPPALVSPLLKPSATHQPSTISDPYVTHFKESIAEPTKNVMAQLTLNRKQIGTSLLLQANPLSPTYNIMTPDKKGINRKFGMSFSEKIPRLVSEQLSINSAAEEVTSEAIPLVKRQSEYFEALNLLAQQSPLIAPSPNKSSQQEIQQNGALVSQQQTQFPAFKGREYPNTLRNAYQQSTNSDTSKNRFFLEGNDAIALRQQQTKKMRKEKYLYPLNHHEIEDRLPDSILWAGQQETRKTHKLRPQSFSSQANASFVADQGNGSASNQVKDRFAFEQMPFHSPSKNNAIRELEALQNQKKDDSWDFGKCYNDLRKYQKKIEFNQRTKSNGSAKVKR